MLKKVIKPWGYETWFAETPQYVGKILFIREGERLSLQYHERKHETLYVLDGMARITVNGECSIMLSGRAIQVEPLSQHRIEAIVDTFIVEVSTPEVDDVVRLHDDYGRVVISQLKELVGAK